MSTGEEPAFTRRTLSKAAGWAVPAVSVGAIVPAVAATPSVCVTAYPFVIGSTTATYTNTTGAAVTFTYTTVVPLGSVANTTVGSATGTGPQSSNAYQPTNTSNFTFPNGTTMSSSPVSAPSGSLSWVVTVTIPADSTLRLSTQALGCKAASPSATVTIDCPFTYPVDCPF